MSEKRDPIRQPQLWEAVADRLRDEILKGEIAPGRASTRWSSPSASARAAGRSARRRASWRAKGSSSSCRGAGSVVSTLTVRDLVEVYAVREALEAGASKVAVERASVAQLDALGAHLDRMEQAMADGDWLAGAENDLAFHRSLVGLAGNGRMSATYEQMLTQTLLLLRTAGSASARLRTEMPAEIHRDLLAALRAA